MQQPKRVMTRYPLWLLVLVYSQCISGRHHGAATLCFKPQVPERREGCWQQRKPCLRRIGSHIFCFVNYFCEQEAMGVAAAASMLRVLIGSKSVSHPHFQTDHRDLQGCALNSCQQMPGSRIVRGS